jgi:basic membrane protein A
VEGDGWEETLKDKGIRVISGPDLIQPDQASRKYGVYLLGEDGNVSNLAAPVLNWGNYYEQILRPVVEGDVGTKMPEGKDQALNYWWGLSADVIDVIVSQKTPYYTRKMLDYLKAGVISGRVSPFQGEIHSQTGLISGKGDGALSDHDIITMNWLNDNVIGTIPNYQDLNEAGRRVAAVIGVKKDKDENTDHS